MANEFIWHDPVEAQQAMSYAANAAKADLVKQENLYRMAELGLRRQQAQETAQLNQLITASQLQQRNIENDFRNRELMQRGELERERNQNYLKGLQIQFPEGRTDSRLAVEASKQQFELEQQKKDEARDAVLSQEWQILDKEIRGLQDELSKPKPSTGFLGLSRGDYNARLEQDKKTQLDLSSKVQRQKIIEAILAERGKVPTTLRGTSPLTTSQLQTAPTTQFQLSMPEARLSPFEMQVRGLTPGSLIEQDGQRYRVVPSF